MSIFKQSITQQIAKFKESFLHSPGLPFDNYFAEIINHSHPERDSISP